MCEAVLAEDGHFLFVCKPASHPLIQQYLTGVELPTHTVRVKRGRERVTHRFRWMPGVPLRDGKDALAVIWLEIEIRNPAGAITYRNSFITDLPVGRDKNETFNVLKTSGYHIEHSFGHGKQNLATLLVTLNLLAFACHTVCDQAEALWRLARSKVSSRAQFFSNLAAITTFLIFPAWHDLVQTLAYTKPPPRPP
jgi:hypothetical protein